MSKKIITEQQVENARKKAFELEQKLKLQTEKKYLKVSYAYCKKKGITLEELTQKIRNEINEPQSQDLLEFTDDNDDNIDEKVKHILSNMSKSDQKKILKTIKIVDK